MYLLLAGNHTVPVLMWHGGYIQNTKCREDCLCGHMQCNCASIPLNLALNDGHFAVSITEVITGGSYCSDNRYSDNHVSDNHYSDNRGVGLGLISVFGHHGRK